MTIAEKFKGIGGFLATYYTDLVYIQNFQLHRKKRLSVEDFVEKREGMFYKFLIEFRVTRNFDKSKSNEVLKHTNDWLDKEKGNDVDGFAELLKVKGLTRDKTMTSLASKILFLNNPWEIFPMDSQAKKALQQKGNDNIYNNFRPLIAKYKNEKIDGVKATLNLLNPYLIEIESDFSELREIDTIRVNRFIDKLLWTNGQPKK